MRDVSRELMGTCEAAIVNNFVVREHLFYKLTPSVC